MKLQHLYWAWIITALAWTGVSGWWFGSHNMLMSLVCMAVAAGCGLVALTIRHRFWSDE